MQVIWTTDVLVYLTGIADQPDPAFQGVAHYKGQLFLWIGVPTPKGYRLFLTNSTGNIELKLTTATWNLGLEVASFITKE